MKSLVGKTLLTIYGEEVEILRKRKSDTAPFIPTFDIYDIQWRNQTLSIRCSELDNFINGKNVFIILDMTDVKMH
jgi:hypothetical protein